MFIPGLNVPNGRSVRSVGRSLTVGRSVGRSLTVGRYGRYGNPKKSKSVHPRPARALTVGRYGRYGRSVRLQQDVKTFEFEVFGPQDLEFEAFNILEPCPWMRFGHAQAWDEHFLTF